MGTEVMYPQDILSIRRFESVPTTSFSLIPRRKPHPGNSNTNPRPHRRPEPKKRREGSPKPQAASLAAPTAKNTSKSNNNGLVMGQVTILRRGESLDSTKASSRGFTKEKDGRMRKKQNGEDTVVLSSEGGGDLIVFGTGRLGPEPAAVPKQIRLRDARKEAKMAVGGVRSDVYAGSAFSLSPSPRALPLPTFSTKGEEGAVDYSATKDLRRLLRLD